MLNYVRKLNNDMDFVVYFPILVISIVTVFFWTVSFFNIE